MDTTAATLERDGTELQLAVGAGMRRVGDGEWVLTDKPEGVSRESPEETGARPAEQVSSAVSSTPEEENDILRRMMERRRQEGSQ